MVQKWRVKLATSVKAHGKIRQNHNDAHTCLQTPGFLTFGAASASLGSATTLSGAGGPEGMTLALLSPASLLRLRWRKSSTLRVIVLDVRAIGTLVLKATRYLCPASPS